MKQIVAKTSKRSSFIPDDDSVRYKLNTQYINNYKSNKTPKKQLETKNDEDNIRYKFPPSSKLKTIEKPKPKPTIKVNFWSKKQNIIRVHKNDTNKDSSSRRHTISGIMSDNKSKSTVKVRKRVSFLPTPVFSDNHIPMVTVPDDLTIQLNEEEANDLGADLNDKNVEAPNNIRNDTHKRPPKTLHNQTNTKSTRRKPSFDSVDTRIGNEYELEFFSKYVVQKLRRMETNQRIYSENLINTVLMFGQLGKLNGKSKIGEN